MKGMLIANYIFNDLIKAISYDIYIKLHVVQLVYYFLKIYSMFFLNTSFWNNASKRR